MEALLLPPGSGPFSYGDDSNYDASSVQTDVALVSVRAALTFGNVLLFCPSFIDPYFNYDTLNLIIEFLLTSLGLVQTLLSASTLNPIIFGVHTGEIIG